MCRLRKSGSRVPPSTAPRTQLRCGDARKRFSGLDRVARLPDLARAAGAKHRPSVSTVACTFGGVDRRLGEVATADAVEEVKHDADYEPDDEAFPCSPW